MCQYEAVQSASPFSLYYCESVTVTCIPGKYFYILIAQFEMEEEILCSVP